MKQRNRDTALNKLQTCINDLMSWNRINMLKSNPDKTEIIHFTSRFWSPNPILNLKVGTYEIVPAKEARDLGFILDSNLTLKPHINKVCSSASKSIRDIGKIRKYLSPNHTERLVHAFISSKLDYCNSLLFGLPSSDICKLQRIQNTAARLVSRTKKFNHITPILKRLHWLPVKQRIIFKILMTTHKSLHGNAPGYISELLHRRNTVRSLRSSTENNLLIPKTNTKSYGDRTFTAAAPKLWNDLPNELKNTLSFTDFKAHLKTHLFKDAYF